MPLYLLYRNGYAFGGFGFWEGRSDAEVCAIITKTDIAFWYTSDEIMKQCNQIILRQFYSIYSIVLVMLWLFVIGKVFHKITSAIGRRIF